MDNNINKDIDFKRIINGNIRLHYRSFLNWNSCYIIAYENGEVIYFNFSKLSLEIDCR